MKTVLILLILLTLSSCDIQNANDDVVKEPAKNGSVEVVMTTKHATGCDVLITEYRVWVAGKVNKYFQKIDTLQSLGNTVEESDEDDNGNTQKVSVPKDYEFYITVK